MPPSMPPLVGGLDCKIGANNNELLFYFTSFGSLGTTNGKEFKSLFLLFTNFHNPWSATRMKSITINSYASQDCSGSSTN